MELSEARKLISDNDADPTAPVDSLNDLLGDGIGDGVATTSSGQWWPFSPLHQDMLSIDEYFALQTVSIARNYDGIAHAQAEKPKRQIDRDVLIPEQPLYVQAYP